MAENKEKTEEIIDETTDEKVCDTTGDVKDDSIDDTVEKPDEKTSEEEKKSELDVAKEQISGLSDRLMRTAAEFDNFKKRTAREKEDFYKMAVCETVAPLLDVLDNIDRAVAAAEESEEGGSVLEGIKMIQKQFADTLTNIGVTEIEAVGCEFDPEKHNAVMMEESDQPENTVIDEFRKGYIYKDKVVRHSMVKVSN